MKHIDQDTARAIYKVLVEHAGAREDEGGDFIYHAVKLPTDLEWRFRGSLGFGGKFYSNCRGWYIKYYQEDENLQRKATVAMVNKILHGMPGAVSNGK